MSRARAGGFGNGLRLFPSKTEPDKAAAVPALIKAAAATRPRVESVGLRPFGVRANQLVHDEKLSHNPSAAFAEKRLGSTGTVGSSLVRRAQSHLNCSFPTCQILASDRQGVFARGNNPKTSSTSQENGTY